MADSTPTAPLPRLSIPRPEFVQLLAFVIVVAWLAAYFMGVKIDQTLTNVVMLVVGFFYGSSASSRSKDTTINALAGTPTPAPPSQT
jgi:hypothetical protein